MKFPLKTKELSWEKSGNAYVLLDKDLGKNFTIDPISFLVWVQCDGKTEVEKIVDIFSVNGNRDIIKAAINGILEKLEGNGLIKWI
ncbi:PqqD family protein [archaeon]|nr:PqqD family protein [archaeon]